jgi:hypothetical protein
MHGTGTLTTMEAKKSLHRQPKSPASTGLGVTLPAVPLRYAPGTGGRLCTSKGLRSDKMISAGSAGDGTACQGRTSFSTAPMSRSARHEEAWEGKDPGSIRVLLSNPRWERRLLRFLELSGVMEDGVDEEEARAGRLGRWIPWEAEEWVMPRAADRFL